MPWELSSAPSQAAGPVLLRGSGTEGHRAAHRLSGSSSHGLSTPESVFWVSIPSICLGLCRTYLHGLRPNDKAQEMQLKNQKAQNFKNKDLSEHSYAHSFPYPWTARGRVIATETVWPGNPQNVIVWAFIERVCQSLL